MKSRKENQNEFVRNFENSTKWIYSDGSCFLCFGNFFDGCSRKSCENNLCSAGILFLADGIIKIIGYFSRDFYCLAFQFDLGFGILMIAVGILILVRREAILRLIFVIFGLVILTDALLRIQMSVEAKKFGLKLWWAVLLIAVATGIFGMLLLVDPAGGAKLTVIFTGVAFLLEGILKLCVVVYTVKIRENENVVWEDEFREI